MCAVIFGPLGTSLWQSKLGPACTVQWCLWIFNTLWCARLLCLCVRAIRCADFTWRMWFSTATAFCKLSDITITKKRKGIQSSSFIISRLTCVKCTVPGEWWGLLYVGYGTVFVYLLIFGRFEKEKGLYLHGYIIHCSVAVQKHTFADPSSSGMHTACDICYNALDTYPWAKSSHCFEKAFHVFM